VDFEDFLIFGTKLAEVELFHVFLVLSAFAEFLESVGKIFTNFSLFFLDFISTPYGFVLNTVSFKSAGLLNVQISLCLFPIY
jgi:hypothetical protein